MTIKEFFNLGYYTSKLDEFLADFNKRTNHLSASQRKEKNKHAAIAKQRDVGQASPPKKTFWDQF